MSSYIDKKTERVFNKVNTFMDNAQIEELVNYVKQVFKLDFTYSIKKVDYLHKRELTSDDILDSCDLGLVNYMFTELYISIHIYAQLFVNGNKTPLGEYYLQNLTDEDINNAKIGLFGDVSFNYPEETARQIIHALNEEDSGSGFQPSVSGIERSCQSIIDELLEEGRVLL